MIAPVTLPHTTLQKLTEWLPYIVNSKPQAPPLSGSRSGDKVFTKTYKF